MDAVRAARAPHLRAPHGPRALARLGRLPLPHGRLRRARVAVVDRAAARPRPLRDRLPAVHRAAALDLEHELGPESLRLMAYWTSYIGFGFRSVERPALHRHGDAAVQPHRRRRHPGAPRPGRARLHLDPPLALRALPAAARRSSGRSSRSRASRTCTPIRGRMVWIYRHVSLLRSMRTTQKAAPLVAIGVAGLFGLGASPAGSGCARCAPGRPDRRARRRSPAAAAGLIVPRPARSSAARPSTAS